MAKSKPIGVRFDTDKLEMIQKEQNLTSVQQVVNYLMDNYGFKEAKRSPNLEDKPIKIDFSSISEKQPPFGLKGIELAIWKSENWK